MKFRLTIPGSFRPDFTVFFIIAYRAAHDRGRKVAVHAHGNTAIRRNMPWEDFVAAYEDGWRRAKAVGDQIGIDILFGIEEGLCLLIWR